MSDAKKLRFPKEFLWGASTSAHQIEGGNHNQWSIWELENAKALAMQAEYKLDEMERWDDIRAAATDPANYVSGKVIDHFHRYKDDFDLLDKLHLNAFRFSVEWSRIEPKEGLWDGKAIEHYRKYIAELQRRNITPVMTLLHFTLPEWFAKKGGFEHRRNIKYFVRYVEYVMTQLGDKVPYVITMNEPEIYAVQSYLHAEWPPQKHSMKLCLWVLSNQLSAHNKAAKIIHRLNRGHKVSIAKNTAHYYLGDDEPMTRYATRLYQLLQDDLIWRRVVKHCDFIGVNHYFSNRIKGSAVKNPNNNTNDLGWDMQPDNLQMVLERLYRKYKKPIMITENGLADMHDKRRKWWLAHTLVALSGAIANDVKLIGYLHWSLLDNFEWAYGRWPRFGLIEVDYKTLKRQIRPSGRWFGTIVGKLRKDSW